MKGKMDIIGSDPVHEHNGKWYFWDESWSNRIGPYESEEEAARKLEQYCEQVLGV